MKTEFGIQTRYQLVSVNPETGVETPLTGVFGNVILTSGRNEMANRDWFTYVQVGNDNTDPDPGHTAMQGHVAGTNTVIGGSDVHGAQATAPFYGWRRKRFRFDQGTISTIIKELGIGWGASGDTLATRALLVDVDGNTTTVTPLATEYVDVIVEVRYYPPLTDATGQVTINSVVYNYTLRASQVTSAAAWGYHIGTKIQAYALFVSDWSFYNGDLAAIDGVPNGVAYPNDNHSEYTNAYSSGSFSTTLGMYAGPTGWSATTGNLARTIVYKTTAGYYQVEFDSVAVPGKGIPKTTGFSMQMQFSLGWAEQSIP